MENLTAKTIAQQLGNRALFMLGAKNLIADKNVLTFRIMKNAKGVQFVKITLNSLDLYDVEFIKLKRSTYETVTINEVNNIYCDQLHKAIETNTGLYTSL